MMKPIKKAAGGFQTTTATATHYATECADYPTEPRYSTDSYVPAHLLEVAQQAIDAAAQGGIQ